LDTKAYTRLLVQLVLLPLLALSLLAVGLGYSLERVLRSAAWVDHSDQVIAGGNRLLLLMVDDETGVRGYFLAHDAVFLEPYNRAQEVLPQQFDQLIELVHDNPAQTARLVQLRKSYTQWNAITQQDLDRAEIDPIEMQSRKRQMDGIRSQTKNFLQAEESLRRQRSVATADLGSRTRWLLTAVILLIGVAIVWITIKAFSRLRLIFAAQLQEADAQRRLAVERELSLSTTLRSIGDGVIACDPAGCVDFMNPVAEQLTGWREQEAKGLLLPEVFNIVTEHTRMPVENPVEKVRRTGNIVGLANHTILIRKDGSEIGIDDSAAPIRGADGKVIGIVLVFRDCTERRSSESALMRAEKLAAAGKLAASIAHEVNNPLEGLTNMLYLAAEAKDVSEVREWLAQAQSEVDRLSHITRRTLGFYRESTQPAAYRPADVLEEVLSFYVPETQRKKVQLEAQIRTQQQIYGVPGELRQVLSNLIANSLDAMGAGGTIRLVVRDATHLKDVRKSGVRITVADTGSGIPRHILPHVFEPFFTTKVDTGTGLGLWVSKELVEKQGGSLSVRSSEVGLRRGTVFSIYLPVDSASLAAPDESFEGTLEDA
jgi:PAS domain S-box-containing protein